MFNELHNVGVKYAFDIRIEESATEICVSVPGWIGLLRDYEVSPILHDLNVALTNLKKNSGKQVVLNTYI